MNDTAGEILANLEKLRLTVSAYYVRGLIKERDALADSCANIARQHGEIQEALVAERQRSDALAAAYKILDELVGEEYGKSFGKSSSLAEAWCEIPDPDLKSIDRLKAQWQAEVLAWAHDCILHNGARDGRKEIGERFEVLGRQAKGEGNENN